MPRTRQPAPAKQSRNPDRTKSRLLRTATRLFSRRGYDGVSVDEIVATAGVNKRMVYHYFGSKEALYSEVLRDVFNRLADLEVQAISGSDDPGEAIAIILKAYFTFLNDNPEFVSLLSWENLHQGRFVKKHPGILSKNPVLQRLDETVKKGISQGIFHRGVNVKHLLISLISVCFLYHANRFTLSQSVGLDLRSRKVLDEGLAHAIDLVLNGLRSREPSRRKSL